jgi:hypothetical protein
MTSCRLYFFFLIMISVLVSACSTHKLIRVQAEPANSDSDPVNLKKTKIIFTKANKIIPDGKVEVKNILGLPTTSKQITVSSKLFKRKSFTIKDMQEDQSSKTKYLVTLQLDPKKVKKYLRKNPKKGPLTKIKKIQRIEEKYKCNDIWTIKSQNKSIPDIYTAIMTYLVQDGFEIANNIGDINLFQTKDKKFGGTFTFNLKHPKDKKHIILKKKYVYEYTVMITGSKNLKKAAHYDIKTKCILRWKPKGDAKWEESIQNDSKKSQLIPFPKRLHKIFNNIENLNTPSEKSGS